MFMVVAFLSFFLSFFFSFFFFDYFVFFFSFFVSLFDFFFLFDPFLFRYSVWDLESVYYCFFDEYLVFPLDFLSSGPLILHYGIDWVLTVESGMVMPWDKDFYVYYCGFWFNDRAS
jgi:hypothetical protein